MEPEPEQPQPERPISKARLYFRMALLPVAFAWLAFLLLAPFSMLLGEYFALGALAFGAAIGIALLIVNPAWVRKVMSTDVKERPARALRPISQSHKVLLTTFSVALALGTGYFLVNVDLKDRGFFTLVAVLLVIDLIRRPLRRAWGAAGSAAGLMVSGALIVLLLKSTEIVKAGEWPMMMVLAGLLLAVDVYQEFKALKRLTPAATPDSVP